MAILLAIPMATFHEFQFVKEDNDNGVRPYCTPYGSAHQMLSYDFDNSSLGSLDQEPENFWVGLKPFDIYSLILMTFQYGIPLAILSVLYANMFFKLRAQQTPGNTDEARDQNLENQKARSLKMMVTVVILFAVCWFPWHAFHFIQLFFPEFFP